MSIAWVLPGVVAAVNSWKMYVFGGCKFHNDNLLIEEYDVTNNKWQILRLKLSLPFNNMTSFATLVPGYTTSTHLFQSVDEAMSLTDYNDRIILTYFTFGKQPP